jgi:hypothetical protein
MRGKLTELKIKIGSEVSQCTDITTELEDLNFKLNEFQNLMYPFFRFSVLLKLKIIHININKSIYFLNNISDESVYNLQSYI